MTRLVGVANSLAAPSGIQLFVREVRSDAAKWVRGGQGRAGEGKGGQGREGGNCHGS